MCKIVKKIRYAIIINIIYSSLRSLHPFIVPGSLPEHKVGWRTPVQEEAFKLIYIASIKNPKQTWRKDTGTVTGTSVVYIIRNMYLFLNNCLLTSSL